MSKVLDGVDFIARAMMILAAFCAFGLAFMILTDILARNLEIKFYGVAEYVRNTIIVIVFLQLPYAVRIRGMLAVDIMIGALPAVARVPLLLLGSLLGVLFFGAIAVGTWEPAVSAWVDNEYEGEGVVRVAAWPARFAIIYGCGLAAFYYLVRIVDILRTGDLPPAPIPAAD